MDRKAWMIVALLAGCGTSAPAPDARPPDAGHPDAAPSGPDARPPDAGQRDAPPSGPDARPADGRQPGAAPGASPPVPGSLVDRYVSVKGTNDVPTVGAALSVVVPGGTLQTTPGQDGKFSFPDVPSGDHQL